jgi:hypothetical protein
MWLLLLFSLPTAQASQRVDIWRKLKRTGALALRHSGYLLPDTPAHRERFEWLAAAVRRFRGDASILHVSGIDRLPPDRLAARFVEARARDYTPVLRDVTALAARRRPAAARVTRARRRFHAIAAIDFFDSPLRGRIERLLGGLGKDLGGDFTKNVKSPPRSFPRASHRRRTWVTRPRPGIDRVACGWLIRRFIDPHARFAFAATAAAAPEHAVPFDTFDAGGFGHRGDDCSFETLRASFDIGDPRVRRMAEIVHDADLGDDKFARTEGIGLDRVLVGWAQQGVSDAELMRRGMELIEGLYQSLVNA